MRTMITRLLVLGVMLAGGLWGNTVAAAGPATALTIEPSAVTLTADESKAFVVTATDKDGVQTDVSASAIFSTNDPLGSTSDSTYSAGRVGTWNVQAGFEGLTALSTITVLPGQLQELTINPNSDPEFVNLDAIQNFIARGYDADSNEVTGFTPAWSVIGEIGSIAQDGVFTPSKLGTGKVQVSVGAVQAQIPVIVKEPIVADAAITNTDAQAASDETIQQVEPGLVEGPPAAEPDETQSVEESAAVTEVHTEACETLANWLWVTILIVFLIGLAILYALVPVTKIWPAIVGLGGAIALIGIHRSSGCDLLPWWDWILAIVTLGLSVLALRQLPVPKPPATGI